MVRISRVTEASIAPLFIRVVTNRVSRVLTLPGPMNSVEIPGDRILQLDIPEHSLYGIRIVIDDQEYRLEQIGDIRQFPRVDAIIIFDGFLYGNYGIVPGYTYRPQLFRDGKLIESGKSFIYPGQVVPYPYSPCTTPSMCPTYPYGWSPF